MSDAYGKRKRRERASRTIRALIVAIAAAVPAGLIVWLAFFPPFSGT